MAEPIIAEIQRKGFEGLITDLTKSSEGFEKLDKSIKGSADELKAIDVIQNNVAKSAGSLRKEYRLAVDDIGRTAKAMDDLEKSGLKNTEMYKNLSKEQANAKKSAGELKDRIGDLNKEIATLGSDTKGIDKFIRAVDLGVNVMGVFQGAQVLLGSKNKALEETLVKLNAVMVISNGLQRIGAELTRQDSVAKIAAAKATQLYNFIVGQSTGALKAFRIALAATGIGLAILAIGALVLNWDKLKSAINGSSDKLQGYIDKISLQVSGQKAVLEQFDNEEKKLQLIGIAEEKIIALRQEKLKQVIQGVRAELDLQDTLVESAIRSNTKLTALKNFNGGVGAIASLFLTSDSELETILKNNKALKDDLDKLEGQSLDLQLRLKAINDKKAKESLKSAEEAFKKFQQLTDAINKGKKEEDEKDKERRSKNRESELKDFEEKAEIAKKLNAESVKEHERLLNSLNKTERDHEKKRRKQAEEDNKDEQQAFEKAQAEKQEKINFYAGLAIDSANELFNATMSIISIQTNNEIDALEEKRKKGTVSEKKYQEELEKIKKEAALKEWRARVAQATIAVPISAGQAFLSQLIPGDPTSLIRAGIAAGVAAAFAAVQLGIVIASKPKFRGGGQVSEKLGLIKGKPHESGGVPIEVEGDEYVMPVRQTKENLKALKAIHEGKFNQLFIPANLAFNADLFSKIPNAANIPHPVNSNSGDNSAIENKLKMIYDELWWLNYKTDIGNTDRKDQTKKVVTKLESKKTGYYV